MDTKNTENIIGNDHNILDKMISILDSLPKKQKQLCKYIIESYTLIGMLTIKELASKADVGPTTVMRLVKRLGFKSYLDMRESLHDIALNSYPNTWNYMEDSLDNKNETLFNESPPTWDEINSVLAKTYTEDLKDNFLKAIDVLINANKIYLLGLRSSRPIADYFHFLLEKFYVNVFQLSFDSETLFDKVMKCETNDVLFVVTTYPYTNKSVEAAKFCHEQGVKIILMTDHLSCPIAKYSDVILKLEPGNTQHSIIPAMAVIEDIIVEIKRKTADKPNTPLEHLNFVLKEYNIYYNDI